jgi:ABC-2 type transport system ATP-binding protein
MTSGSSADSPQTSNGTALPQDVAVPVVPAVPIVPAVPAVPEDAAVWSRGLAKRRGHRWTVQNLDLYVPRGALSGFVGPNGAGKSTTLRMLLGLVRPTAGVAAVLGEPVTKPARYLGRVGAMIEGPTFHLGLSGRANLRQLATLRRLPRRRVDEVLDLVGLADRADDSFATYSLGMKQRLGIAAALLPWPELLVLDEPTNGLDPAGIREIRTLLENLASNGMTVFVSSHLLSEVEQICDHLVMIRAGRLLFQGHVTELLAAGDPTIVCCPENRHDLHRLAGALRAAGLRADIDQAEGLISVHAPGSAAADVNRVAMRAGVTLRGLRTHRPSLEETFLRATGDVDGDVIPRERAGAHDGHLSGENR